MVSSPCRENRLTNTQMVDLPVYGDQIIPMRLDDASTKKRACLLY
jgi:hypothetical protein